MRKPSALNKQDDTLNPFAKHAKSYRHIEEEEASPDSYDNSHTSDTDSVSCESRKIRKKRNTYHKISDDIRVQLLEAVQNGETLKSAAKRHNINYSSAKSILHTYRKEGRILKKSVQERSFKKRADPIESEAEQTPKKQKKASKKEDSTLQLPIVTRNFEDPTDELTEEMMVPQQQHNVRKSERIRINQITHSGAKVDNLENVVVKGSTPSQVEQPAMAMASVPASVPPQQVQYAEQHYYANAGGNHHNDHKMFDNFFNSYSTEASYRNTMQLAYDGQEDHYHMDYQHQHHNHNHQQQYPKEFDSFNDMMDTLHRPMRNYGYQDANTFLCSREVNTAHLFDERGHKGGNDGHCNNNYDSGMSSVFKGFLDTQNMFRDTLGESSFGNNENNFRSRKDSIDFS